MDLDLDLGGGAYALWIPPPLALHTVFNGSRLPSLTRFHATFNLYMLYANMSTHIQYVYIYVQISTTIFGDFVRRTCLETQGGVVWTCISRAEAVPLSQLPFPPLQRDDLRVHTPPMFVS